MPQPRSPTTQVGVHQSEQPEELEAGREELGAQFIPLARRSLEEPFAGLPLGQHMTRPLLIPAHFGGALDLGPDQPPQVTQCPGLCLGVGAVQAAGTFGPRRNPPLIR